MRKLGWIIITSAYLTTVGADQTLLANVGDANRLFWSQVYPGPSYTLYCGEKFNGKNSNLAIEKVYPLQWAVEFLGCESIGQCRKDSQRFNRIESDLHNYYPILESISRVRKDFTYGDIPGEFREFFECDFEYDVRTSTIEPREIARGNIARSLFYMHWEYGLPLNRQTLDMLLVWHANDPPSNDEKRRNNIIEKLQGTRNSFIDRPETATQLANKPRKSDSSAATTLPRGEIGI